MKRNIYKLLHALVLSGALLGNTERLFALDLDITAHLGWIPSSFESEDFKSGTLSGTALGARFTFKNYFDPFFFTAGYVDPRFVVRGYTLPGNSNVNVKMNYLESSGGFLFGGDFEVFRFGLGIGLGYGRLLSVDEHATGYSNEELFNVYVKDAWFFEVPVYLGFYLNEYWSLELLLAYSRGIAPVYETLFRKYSNASFHMELAVTYRLKL